MSIGFSIQDEAMGVARSAPQGAHYHADVIYEQGPYGTPSLAYTNTVPDQQSLYSDSLSSVCHGEHDVFVA